MLSILEENILNVVEGNILNVRELVLPRPKLSSRNILTSYNIPQTNEIALRIEIFVFGI